MFNTKPTYTEVDGADPLTFVGLWVSAAGFVRHELLPEGRYVEARGKRQNAYQGNYRVNGRHIEYEDDTGFTADGDFRDGALHHAGMIFYKVD